MSDQDSGTRYAGDITPLDAWKILEANPAAQLVDVRTRAEWSFVGIPDLGSLGREAHLVEWQSFPSMAANPDFQGSTSRAIRNAGADASTPIVFLCRSGTRSRAAAIAMTQAGFAHAFNIAGGFEGDLDEKKHRGQTNGWKASGLPWRQS